jgi:hypothetical protein
LADEDTREPELIYVYPYCQNPCCKLIKKLRVGDPVVVAGGYYMPARLDHPMGIF